MQTLQQSLQLLSTIDESNLQPKTIDTYSCSVRLIERLFDDKNMDEYDVAEIQGVFALMAKMGYSKSQIHQVRVLLNKAFKLYGASVHGGWNPIVHTAVPKNASEKTVNALTVQEQRKLEEICEEDAYGYLYVFMLYSGLRSEELRNMQWEDYNSHTGTLRVPKSKTKAGIREIPLLQVCRAIILKQPKKNEFIFNSKKGTPITASVLRRTYERLRKKTEIQALTNHVCRHTFATRLVESGTSLKAISALLGHTSVSFTLDRYVTDQTPFLQQELAAFGNKFKCSFKMPNSFGDDSRLSEIDGQLHF